MGWPKLSFIEFRNIYYSTFIPLVEVSLRKQVKSRCSDTKKKIYIYI